MTKKTLVMCVDYCEGLWSEVEHSSTSSLSVDSGAWRKQLC